MNIALYTLTSALHNEASVKEVSEGFISEIEKAIGFNFNFKGNDFRDYGNADLDLIFVRTGGTEGLFKEVFPSLKGNILLLTSGKSNSLAASMEILSYLNQKGRKGEIIHGSTDYISSRIKILSKVSTARKKLNGQRVGVIGKPSDWLISSDVDKSKAKEVLGMDIIDIEIDELVNKFNRNKTYQLSAELESMKTDMLRNATEKVKSYADGAFRIYVALKEIVNKHNLSALTLRCFDLLDRIGNTGCLALAILNAEGIPAGCEGDVPTLLTMCVGNALTGQSGFQANPSRIDPESGEILFAHCTIPFNMINSFHFNTHFESGIGIAIQGDMPIGEATIFKLSGDISKHFSYKAELLRNQCESNLCRTQVVIKLDGDKQDRSNICRNYFLKSPIGNHHVIFSGDQKELFESFMSY